MLYEVRLPFPLVVMHIKRDWEGGRGVKGEIKDSLYVLGLFYKFRQENRKHIRVFYP